MVIQKAKNLFDDLKQEGETATLESFPAGRGWFERFKERNNLHSIKLNDEAVTGGTEATEKYSLVLKKELRLYSAARLHRGGNSLYWKLMPKRSFISTEEDFSRI